MIGWKILNGPLDCLKTTLALIHTNFFIETRALVTLLLRSNCDNGIENAVK